MKKLAMIVTRGVYNNVLQACELARLAGRNGAQVSILFRDEAVARMTLDKAKELTFSDAYRGREAKVREMLREQKKNDLQALLQELKEQVDVKLSLCRESIAYFEIKVEHIFPEIDEVQPPETFWKEEIEQADHVLTF